MRKFRYYILYIASSLFMAAHVHSQTTLTTLITNGPTANRINIVILAEGYTAGELPRFLVDATNAANNLLQTPPYNFYQSYFNAFTIGVASAESGSDHYTPTRQLVDTYFNSSYDSYNLQRFVTIPPNDRNRNYSDGQGKVDALLQQHLPEYDLVILLVNDPQYGGSGGEVLISSLNIAAAEIIAHESGHTFAGLADEYSAAYPGYTPIEEHNSTTETNRGLIKWLAWIAESTPVPTPGIAPYFSVVGLFEGAQYQTAGWYRPKYDCKMNHLDVGFCEVCVEQTVRSVYQRLAIIEASSPAEKNLLLVAQPVEFRISALEPHTNTLAIQWFTNNVPVPGATNETFTVQPAEAPEDQDFVVQAQATDLTPLVRSDPGGALSRSVAWNLTPGLTELTLSSGRVLPDKSFSFVVTGVAPAGFVLEASTNLLSWRRISTNTLVNGQCCFTNSDPMHSPARYYRALAIQ